MYFWASANEMTLLRLTSDDAYNQKQHCPFLVLALSDLWAVQCKLLWIFKRLWMRDIAINLRWWCLVITLNRSSSCSVGDESWSLRRLTSFFFFLVSSCRTNKAVWIGQWSVQPARARFQVTRDIYTTTLCWLHSLSLLMEDQGVLTECHSNLIGSDCRQCPSVDCWTLELEAVAFGIQLLMISLAP